MSWQVSANPVSPKSAIEWFRARLPMTDDEYDELVAEEKAHAFTLANTSQLDLVTQVHDAIGKALEDGTDFEEFKASVGEKLEQHWGGSVANPPARLDTIFRTNTALAHGAGRYRELTDPEIVKVRPYRLLDTVPDKDQSDICKALTKPPVVMPADSPAWDRLVCPLHHGCRSGWRSLRASQAKEYGILEEAPSHQAADGFGKPPDSKAWAPTLSDYPSGLAGVYREKRDQHAEDS